MQIFENIFFFLLNKIKNKNRAILIKMQVEINFFFSKALFSVLLFFVLIIKTGFRSDFTLSAEMHNKTSIKLDNKNSLF
jgi:hypothetical protein